MKNFIKGFLTGIICAILIGTVFADDFPVLFNQVRLCVNGGTKANWDENIKNSDWDESMNYLPSSILYRDTTYVPLRFVSNEMKKKVIWNGDSKTVGIIDGSDFDFHRTKITEKADLNGNVWEYSILKSENNKKYLSAKDNIRGYERVYSLEGSGDKPYRMTDEAIWFVTSPTGNSYNDYSYLYKLSFLNDENSQDGEKIMSLGYKYNGVFDDKYLYAARLLPSTTPGMYLYAIDLDNGVVSDEELFRPCGGISISLTEFNQNEAVLNLTTYNNMRETESIIKFDKTTSTFLRN